MKNKKILIAVIALAAVLGLMLGLYFGTREEPQAGGKQITVTVVHKDGSEKVFECQTDAEKLADVLVAENIVVDNQTEFGLYILTADGETADYNADGGWWAVYIGDQQAMEGASSINIEDGGSYKLVYTIG